MTEWHPETDELVALALADVEPAGQERLIAHLAACPACRDEYDTLSDGLAQALAATPSIAPPPGFSGRVLAAMAPQPATQLRAPRARLLLAAAAVLVGLLSGIGGTLAVLGSPAGPTGPATTAAPVAAQLLTAAGDAVGSVGITARDGRTYVLLNITSARPGASYECLLVGADGSRTSGGRWSLTSEYGAERASGAWLVPLTGEPPAAVELVTPNGTVWSEARF